MYMYSRLQYYLYTCTCTLPLPNCTDTLFLEELSTEVSIERASSGEEGTMRRWAGSRDRSANEAITSARGRERKGGREGGREKG